MFTFFNSLFREIFRDFMLYLSTFLQKNEKIFFKMLVILKIIRIFAPCFVPRCKCTAKTAHLK